MPPDRNGPLANAELLAELSKVRAKRGLFATIRALRRHGLSLPLALLWVLRIG